MAIPSKQCLATALVHLQAKRKWRPLEAEIVDVYFNSDTQGMRDYYKPIYHNSLKSNNQMMWTPTELMVLRQSKISPNQLRKLLVKP